MKSTVLMHDDHASFATNTARLACLETSNATIRNIDIDKARTIEPFQRSFQQRKNKGVDCAQRYGDLLADCIENTAFEFSVGSIATQRAAFVQQQQVFEFAQLGSLLNPRRIETDRMLQ